MTPGIHDGVPMEKYLALPYVSATLLHNVLTYSPAHARYWQAHPDAPTDRTEMGEAIHADLAGMDIIQPIDCLDWRTKEAKQLRDMARACGQIPMLAHKVPLIEAAVKAARQCIAESELAGIFERGKPEQTIIWDEGGTLCKARPDWLTDDRDVLLHVKTTKGSANPEVWIRSQLDQAGYDVAAAWYERALRSLADVQHFQRHVFLVVEQEPPHGCSLVSLDPAMWDIAHGKVERALKTWQLCVASGSYPGYSRLIHYAEPLAYQLARHEETKLSSIDNEQVVHGLQP